MKKAVVGIVVFEDQILVGKKILKKDHFLSGRWHIPGGHVSDGESEENALIREFKEETNLDIEIVKKICSCQNEEKDKIVSWFLCATTSRDATPGDDLCEIEFIPKNRVLETCDSRAISLWPKEVLVYLHS